MTPRDVHNLQDEDWIPQVMPLSGKAPVNIFGGGLLVDLDEIAQAIDEFG